MKKITVVSLGPGDPDLMTLATDKQLRSGLPLVLRTGRHPVADILLSEGIAFETLDDYYGRYDDFDEMHLAMAQALWKKAGRSEMTFAVQDAVSDGAVRALRTCKPTGATLKILPGISPADCCLAAAGTECNGGIRILPASDLENARPDPGVTTLITEIDSELLAGEVKLWAERRLDDESPVFFFPSCVETLGKPRVMTLADTDRQKHYDHTACLLIPGTDYLKRQRFILDDLDRIMTVLRRECPWDRVQTHESLREYMVEEAWEAVSAINDGDTDHLADELGDVLLQIVFHASIAEACGEFDLNDVVNNICRKMIYRHAHIFGDAKCETKEQVSENWEKLKQLEKGTKSVADNLDDVAGSLPALKYAVKMRKRAASVPDYKPDTATLMRQLKRETEALENSLTEEQLSDLLFDAAEICALQGFDPELLLRTKAERFREEVRQAVSAVQET